jgi:hypothetical protein
MVAQTKTVEPTVVNGINVDDLFALIEGVRRDADKGKTNWRVTTTWQGQTRSRAQVEGFQMAENGCRAGSPSTSTNLASLVERTGSPIHRNICWRRLTPA